MEDLQPGDTAERVVKRLLIIGAGGFGREVLGWAQQTLDFTSEWVFGGFLDDNPQALDGFGYGESVIGSVSGYAPGELDFFVCAVGNPRTKEALVRTILEKGGRFVTLIHPSVIMGNHVILGRGVILCPRVVLTSDIVVGDFVSLNVGTAVGHDVVIGDWSQTSAFCDLTGFTRLGKGVLMGSHATLLPRRKVGDYAVVGAGSVVVRDVKGGETVFGVPAMPLRGGTNRQP
jgi:sugar O-acyltransferase (sialic acid O-acetyltransferase NeuD family)